MRGGGDAFLPYDRKHGAPQHNAQVVYSEMLLQCCRHYAGLPDPRSMGVDEILFFYDALRPELKRATGPKPKK